MAQAKQNMATKFSGARDWIGWAFFFDLAVGLSVTLSYLFTKTVTTRYPDEEKWVPFPRYRGHHFLRMDENGDNKCVACELCAKICPCFCITVIPYEDENGNRRPLRYDLDTSRCLFCGLCEDACPVEAIALGQLYEFSSYTKEGLKVGKEELLGMPGKTEVGGTVVKARLVTTEDGVRVEEREGQGYHWWDRIRRRGEDGSDRD